MKYIYLEAFLYTILPFTRAMRPIKYKCEGC